MFRKLAFSILATAAVIGASMTIPTAASAFGGFHGNAGARGGAIHANVGFNRGGNIGFNRGNGCARFGCWHPHPHPHWHVHYRPRIWGVAPVVYAAAPIATAPTCNCLTKEYTPEGAVLFKDNCTNEAAINPPQAQQTGMLQPQQ